MTHPERDVAPLPTVRATPNGPYRVQGVARISWQEPVTTDDGEPVAWRHGAVVVEGQEEHWLCRCGNSRNKPFCDSSHRRVGFAASDDAEPGWRADRATEYPGTGLVVSDDRSLCAHAGFCATRATNVWKMTRDTDRTDVRSLVVAMVQRCPSGALGVLVDDEELEPRLPVEIGLVPDGPLTVTGGVRVVRSDGVPLETRNRVALCRCGQSANKPLCDGSHARNGFRHRPGGTEDGQNHLV
jgi:CDGSH-type Zn-finger protein